MPSFKPVIALARGLEILRVVNEERRATVKAIHLATQLDKATIVRMLETLEHEGYVLRDADEAIYSPTGRTLVLSQGYDRHIWMGKVAEPILGAFRNRIGWPSDLALCDRDAMVIVQTSRGQGPLSFNRTTGFRAPVLATSLGLCYLAFCDAEERERIIATLSHLPGIWNELARHPRKLKTMLDDVRAKGYAIMDEAYGDNVYGGALWAFGVPVKSDTEIFGSINIMMLRSAVSHETAISDFLVPLQETAEQLAQALSARESAAAIKAVK